MTKSGRKGRRSGPSKIILLNKPFGVLCTFTDPDGRPTLADFVSVPEVYAAGRLDKDSEGLLLLTNDGGIQHRISHPQNKKEKGYWVQVEGIPDESALQKLRNGVQIKGGRTRPARVRCISEPDIWEREPPIRHRANIPTTWLEIFLREGMNRQLRKMTASVGYPTLRLVRFQVGDYNLGSLNPGQWELVEPAN